jgi:hypothetical protein
LICLWISLSSSSCSCSSSSSSSSISFTTLCGFWLSHPGHFKSFYSSQPSHSLPSYRYTHHPAILFLVFLSIGLPLVSILILF